MNLFSIFYKLMILCIGILSTIITNAQELPTDFKVIATAGGMMPGSEVGAIYIQVNGTTSYTRHISSDPKSDPLDYHEFTLTPGQLGQIWQVIQANEFFSLNDEYADPTISDRTYASLTVTANSTTHTVWTTNIALPAFDTIISTINSITLPQYNLIYDISVPVIAEQKDICELKGTKSISYYNLKPSRENPEPQLKLKPEIVKSGSYDPPGTAVALEMSLQQAVAKGIVSFSSKYNYWGDAMSISAENTVPYTSDIIKVRIGLEFFGEGASPGTAAMIKKAIEDYWNNRVTSDGSKFEVEVDTRVARYTCESGSNYIFCYYMTGAAGYHQVELVNHEIISSVYGRGSEFNLNSGAGSGRWSTVGDNLPATYAHEAGHLLNMPDQYIDYRKQSDGNWKFTGEDGEYNYVSSDLLAAEYFSSYGTSEVDLKAYLNTEYRFCPPKAGHENDLMATLKGMPLQADIEQIAANAGLVIRAEPGDVLISKVDPEQNIVIDRDTRIFLDPGESIQLDGLYGACIDADKNTPSLGSKFDVSPNLIDWSNIEAAGYLNKLLTYINENELFCEDNYDYQKLIWRITDNDFNYDRALDSILVKAGIDIGDRMLDFPRMTNPFSYSSEINYVIPQQLYTIDLAASPGFIIEQPQIISIDANVSVLTNDDIVSDFNWILKKPAGSSSQLSTSTGNSVTINPDIRGIYKLNIEANFTDLSNLEAVLVDSQLIVLADEYTETFESANLSSTPPFVWVTAGSGGWEITNEVSHTGTYSLCSGKIGNNEKSEISLSIATSENDSIFFACKVSSETGFDFLRFYIDESLISTWSGESDWRLAGFPVPKGNHTLKWTYEKDDVFLEGADRCWIDDLFLPNSSVTRIDENLSLNYYKLNAYPNPVEHNLTLRYYLGSRQKISAGIYDISGKFIRLLSDEISDPGIRTETYNLDGLKSGWYIIKIQNDENTRTSSVSFIKE